MNDGIIHYPATGRSPANTDVVSQCSTAEVNLTLLLNHIDDRLADLERTGKLLVSAAAAMDSGDIDRMQAVADVLRDRIAARRARMDARKAA